MTFSEGNSLRKLGNYWIN